MAKRGTPQGDKDYWSVQPGDFAFFPPELGLDPVYPEGDDATRAIMLWDYFTETNPGDWRFFGDEGMTAWARWLRMEQAYHQMGLDILDLPGDTPVKLWQRSGLI